MRNNNFCLYLWLSVLCLFLFKKLAKFISDWKYFVYLCVSGNFKDRT